VSNITFLTTALEEEEVDPVPPTSAVDENGKLPAITMDNDGTLKTKDVSMVTKDMGSDAPTNRLATQIGPDLVPSAHYAEDARNVAAGVAGRIVGKAKPFKPTPKMLGKIESMVTQFKHDVLTPEMVAEWASLHTDIASIASGKWTIETLERSIDDLLNVGVGAEELRWAAKVKDEVLPDRGKAPRLVLDCGPSGQLMSLAVVHCLEWCVSHYFSSTNIKHKGKYDAVKQIFSRLNGVQGRVLEGDGKSWDTTVSPELRHALEDKLIIRVAELLFENGDAAGTLLSWVTAGLSDRAKNKRSVTYRKSKQFAFLILRAFRASGDRGTSILNWIVNFVVWACVILDKPHVAVSCPDQTIFKNDNGETVTFARGMEGDDSVVKTDSALTNEEIVAIWDSLGFTMELQEREGGQHVVFVGLTAYVTPRGFISGVFLPEPNRNVASASWTLKEGPPEQYALSFAARAAFFSNHPPLANYFRACGRHWWQQSEGVRTQLSRDDQYRLFGDYDTKRTDTFERLSEVKMCPELADDIALEVTRKLIEAYCGEAMTIDQEAVLLSLDVVRPEDAEYLRGCFPPGMLQ